MKQILTYGQYTDNYNNQKHSEPLSHHHSDNSNIQNVNRNSNNKDTLTGNKGMLKSLDFFPGGGGLQWFA